MDVVLNAVELAPDNPFEFAAPEFGVRMEDPPEDLGDDETFIPNIADLLRNIVSSTAGNMQMEKHQNCHPPW